MKKTAGIGILALILGIGLALGAVAEEAELPTPVEDAEEAVTLAETATEGEEGMELEWGESVLESLEEPVVYASCTTITCHPGSDDCPSKCQTAGCAGNGICQSNCYCSCFNEF